VSRKGKAGLGGTGSNTAKCSNDQAHFNPQAAFAEARAEHLLAREARP
jgi:hypothetical protein